MIKSQTVTLIFVLILASTAIAHTGATGIVKERMDLFKRNQDNLKAIKGYVGNKNFEPIIPLASEIRDWAAKMPKYFPAGSNKKPSEASPAIWQNFQDFEKAARDNELAASNLINAARSKDINAVLNAFKSVAVTCKSFHKSFKLD